MSVIRKITRHSKSQPTVEGAGVHLKRAFQHDANGLYDPFLLLDDFRSDFPEHYRPGFPWHPHRGIETITYMLLGRVTHGDSLGNEGTIEAGDVQWMTAGSGIIHQEMPLGDPQGRMYGFQLWANLPKAQKMMPPRYREVKSSQIPVVTTPGGAQVRIVSGQIGDVRGPVEDIVTNPTYLDISLPEGVDFVLDIPTDHTVLTYVIEGEGSFGSEQTFRNGALLVLADGDQVVCQGGDTGMRCLLFAGKPIGEPVAWYGPVVMNTIEELRQAFDEIQAGTFIK